MGALALAAVLGLCCSAARAGEEAKFPDWSGQWLRTYGGNPRYDQTKPIRKQEAPLKPEYQVRYEASLKDQDEGGHGLDRGYSCLPQGMPRMMSGVSPFEFLFAPDITHILFERTEFAPRRIYTDGRDWPKDPVPTFQGYSIGKWLDTDGDGRFDTLETETRYVKGPRTYDTTGLPLHADNKTVVKEKMYTDKENPNLILNEITTFDSALTGPWTVTKKYFRSGDTKHNWLEEVCAENNPHVHIQNDNYMLSADGLLMPSRKGQKAPDLKNFKQAGQ
jgi:hypothetical protein